MDPSMAKSKKLAGVKEFCAGAKFTPITSNFVATMAEYGRLKELHKISLRFEEQCMASRNEVKCVITTAQALTPAQLTKVTESMGIKTSYQIIMVWAIKISPSYG